MPPNLAFVMPNPIVTRGQCLERIGGRPASGPQVEVTRCGSVPYLSARTRSCCSASVPQHKPCSPLHEQRGCVQPSCSHGGQRTGQNHVRRKKTSATCLHYIPSRGLDPFSSLDLVRISEERGIPRLCLTPGTQCCGPRGLCCYGAAPERGYRSCPQPAPAPRLFTVPTKGEGGPTAAAGEERAPGKRGKSKGGRADEGMAKRKDRRTLRAPQKPIPAPGCGANEFWRTPHPSSPRPHLGAGHVPAPRAVQPPPAEPAAAAARRCPSPSLLQPVETLRCPPHRARPSYRLPPAAPPRSRTHAHPRSPTEVPPPRSSPSCDRWAPEKVLESRNEWAGALRERGGEGDGDGAKRLGRAGEALLSQGIAQRSYVTDIAKGLKNWGFPCECVPQSCETSYRADVFHSAHT